MNDFNFPRAEQWDMTNKLLAKLVGAKGVVIDINNWDDVLNTVNLDIHKEVFSVGDVFQSKYQGALKYDRIVDFNKEDTGDPSKPRSITLQPIDVVDSSSFQFSAPQALCNAGDSGIAAGTHYFTVGGQQYEVTLTKAVPPHGILFVSTWITKMASYEEDRVTAIETGRDITTTSGQTDTLTMEMNHYQRCQYGSNNYVESGIHQWLNYDGENFQHTFMTDFDRPSNYPLSGFLNRLDPDLVAVLGEVNKTVARNTVNEGGGFDTFRSKVFLLSRTEMGYGGEGAVGTEEVYQYWNGKTNADKIMGNPSTWWLRSPIVGNASHVRLVRPSGDLDSNLAYVSLRLAPAYAIIQTQ